MPIDFPNSPSIGDTFLAGGILRKWDGTVWAIIPQTVSGPAGSSGIISVEYPIINTGSSTEAVIKIDQVSPFLLMG